MSNPINVELTHSSGVHRVQANFEGTPDEVAAFSAKFSEFVKLLTPEDPSSHWSGLTSEERKTALQGSTPTLYGGQPYSSGKIPAIKMHRHRTGVGLKDSKDAIEAYLEGVQSGRPA